MLVALVVVGRRQPVHDHHRHRLARWLRLLLLGHGEVVVLLAGVFLHFFDEEVLLDLAVLRAALLALRRGPDLRLRLVVVLRDTVQSDEDQTEPEEANNHGPDDGLVAGAVDHGHEFLRVLAGDLVGLVGVELRPWKRRHPREDVLPQLAIELRGVQRPRVLETRVALDESTGERFDGGPRAVLRRIVGREALELRAVGLVQAAERRARHRRTRGHREHTKRLQVVVPRLDVLDRRLGARPEGNRPEQLVEPDRDATLLRKRLRLRLAEADGLDIRRVPPQRVLADVADVALAGPEAIAPRHHSSVERPGVRSLAQELQQRVLVTVDNLAQRATCEDAPVLGASAVA
mmetsp:Transcript_22904/g.68489  ORF Transcript_22904/g.68489 Transcript_22904/m.68489 type:complete len:347 (-) Transcript_22904:283-1323(-)